MNFDYFESLLDEGGLRFKMRNKDIRSFVPENDFEKDIYQAIHGHPYVEKNDFEPEIYCNQIAFCEQQRCINSEKEKRSNSRKNGIKIALIGGLIYFGSFILGFIYNENQMDKRKIDNEREHISNLEKWVGD